MGKILNSSEDAPSIDPYLFKCFKEKQYLKPLTKEDEKILLERIENNFDILILPWILTTPDYKKASFLEIGCGDGKYGYYISKYLKHYTGIDIREISIKSAQNLLKNNSNCTIILNDGRTLTDIKDNSQQFIFRYQTFIHMPDENIIWGYIQEIIRVLANNGVAKIQLLGPMHKKGYRVEWHKLGNYYFKMKSNSVAKKALRMILNVIPPDFIFPIFKKNSVYNQWGEFGAFIHSLKAIDFVNKCGAYGEIMPSFYNTFYGSNTHNIYWLVITKDKNFRPYFVTLA